MEKLLTSSTCELTGQELFKTQCYVPISYHADQFTMITDEWREKELPVSVIIVFLEDFSHPLQ